MSGLRCWRDARQGFPRRLARLRASKLRGPPAVAIAAASPPFTRIESIPPNPPCICRSATSCPGKSGKPGIKHFRHRRMLLETRGEARGRSTLPAHARKQRSQPRLQQPRLERACHAAILHLHGLDARPEFIRRGSGDSAAQQHPSGR